MCPKARKGGEYFAGGISMLRPFSSPRCPKWPKDVPKGAQGGPGPPKVTKIPPKWCPEASQTPNKRQKNTLKSTPHTDPNTKKKIARVPPCFGLVGGVSAQAEY